MLPNYLVLPLLVANVSVFYFLNADRIKTYIVGVRGQRQINAFRVAGLLLVLVAVGHSQNIPCVRNGRVDKACQKRSAAYQTPFVAGVIRDSDYEEARAIAKANGIVIPADWSRGEDVYSVSPEDQDWTNLLWTPETSKAHPKLAKALSYTWAHAGALLIFAIIGFLVLQLAGGHEADETNIHEQLDPDYRTGFVNDYHGDDAFEVPDGMHSQHQAVPVRSRSAAAGR